MKTTQKPQTDAQWMALLDTEPDRAMEALVAQYTALICHEAGKYLENPDDVKDCVSETFAEVYTHRAAYDPEKGALSTWIGTIARNKAISAYRKAARAPGRIDADAISDNGDEMTSAEQAVDVEQAIAQLSETDQQIIRMKYYENMSIAEIAESLQIPYETVKKRHTRSIKKLRNSLLTILILAALLILAACGVIQVLRHFGVLPGYGVTADDPENCYILSGPVVYEEAPFTAYITAASLFDGELSVEYELAMDKTEYDLPEYDENGDPTWRGLSCADVLCDPSGETLAFTFSSGAPLNQDEWGEFTRQWRPSVTLEKGTLREILKQEQPEFALRLGGIQCDGVEYGDILVPFTLTRAKLSELDDYAYLYDEETGGLMLSSELADDGTLALHVYPVSNGFSEYSMGLTRRLYDTEAVEAPVTIVDEAGTVYEGANDQFVISMYFGHGMPYATYTFSDIVPGKYTLSLPYVYLIQSPEKTGSLHWNLLDGTFRKGKAKFPGGTLETVSIQPTEPEFENYYELADYFWEIRVKAQMDREDMTLVETKHADEIPWKLSAKFNSLLCRLGLMEPLVFSGYGVGYGELDPETGELVFQAMVSEGSTQALDFSRIKYVPATPQSYMCVRYDHPVELEFEVK